MKTLVSIMVIFGLAVALALLGHQDFGYAVLVLPTHRVELSIALSVVLVLGAFIVGYVLVRGANHALRLPAQVREHRRAKREAAAREAFLRAVAAFVDRHWDDAARAGREAASDEALRELAGRLADESERRAREPVH
jgi:HemY protein